MLNAIQKTTKRAINLIVIHCAATKPSMDIGVKEITAWHRARGFFTVGYHYIIRRSGAIELGRPIDQAGAHAEGHNAHSVGVCLVGGINDKGRPENNFTDAQWNALEDLIKLLKQQYPNATIKGHNELPNVSKACPCFSVAKWLKNGMKKV